MRCSVGISYADFSEKGVYDRFYAKIRGDSDKYVPDIGTEGGGAAARNLRSCTLIWAGI